MLLPVCSVMMFFVRHSAGAALDKVRSQYSFERFESELDEILSHLETESAKP